jgi:hypothetical protein
MEDYFTQKPENDEENSSIILQKEIQNEENKEEKKEDEIRIKETIEKKKFDILKTIKVKELLEEEELEEIYYKNFEIEYVILAEFDIEKGNTIKKQFPSELSDPM